MGWKKEMKQKLTAPENAVTKIESGMRVVVGHACAEPSRLINSLVEQKENFKDVEIVHMVPMGDAEYTNEGMEEHFRHNALFAGSTTYKAIAAGRADYTPSYFFEIPRLFKKNYLPVDVALVQLSYPDQHGYCSFGVSVDYTKTAVEEADIVIAEINDKMPRTHGSYVHISKLDYVVESSYQITELPAPKIGDVEEKIGSNVANLIEDGSTLQLGIGAIPDAVLTFLDDKKNLGIHSEMISDGVVELVEKGVINNSKKSIHQGKIVVTFLMGTQKLYDFVDDNPTIEALPVEYTNNPQVIGQNDNLISINSAVEVDFMGQVAAETIKGNQISGVGGQVDFVRGTSFSKGGKSIIAMPSTAAGGKVSRIVPKLTAGTPVTTSRNDIHYVVTEYGVAELRGKTLQERAKALINIAHPDFRDELKSKIQ